MSGPQNAPLPVIPRTGIGIDVHAYAPADAPQPLWLGGLFWDGERGLSGHSDGDPVAHAAADALFSACGVGDLGTHFGTDRPEYAGASGARTRRRPRSMPARQPPSRTTPCWSNSSVSPSTRSAAPVNH